MFGLLFQKLPEAWAADLRHNLNNVEGPKVEKSSKILILSFPVLCGIISGLMITRYLRKLHHLKVMKLYRKYLYVKYVMVL